MRAQIIPLDEYDDLESVRDKLMRVKLPQAFLIIPTNGSILKIPHELLLLKRVALRLGITFAIISTRKELILQCDDLKIFHFPTIKDGKESNWQAPTHIEKTYFPKPRRMLPESEIFFGKRVIPIRASIYQKAGLIAAVIISFSIVLLVIGPSATILIHPKNIVQTSSLKLSSSSGVDGSARREFVPAYPLTRVISEAIVITTSGSTIINDEYATGTVRFENLTEEVVRVPSGTVVITTGEHPIRYLSTEDGVIPAGVGEYGLVDVQATRAGQEGNIGSNEVKIVEGFLGSMVLVTNPTSLKGGSEVRVAAASDEDRLSAERDLSIRIQKKCAIELSNAVPAGDIFLGISPSFEVVATEAFPDETQPSGFFFLGMEVSCIGWYARMEDILTLATQVLDEEMPGEFRAADEIVTYKVSAITNSKDSYRWEVSLERSITPVIDRSNLVMQILGKNQSKALKMVEEQLFLEEKPKFEMFPSWWPLMPFMASQIQVEITE